MKVSYMLEDSRHYSNKVLKLCVNDVQTECTYSCHVNQTQSYRGGGETTGNEGGNDETKILGRTRTFQFIVGNT